MARQMEQVGRIHVDRQHYPGYYSDHGLGREMIWYEDRTVVTLTDVETGDIENLTVTGEADYARVSWNGTPGAPRRELIGKTPVGIADTHEGLADYWISRRLATLQEAHTA